MSYDVPQHRLAPIREVLGALSRAERILLTTHVNSDGDGAGCQAALAAWLRGQGKEAWIVNPTPFPDSFAFLLPHRGWLIEPGSAQGVEVTGRIDLAVVLDTGEVPRIGRVADLVGEIPKVVVDHHPPGPDPIAGISFRDPEAAATGELLYDLFKVSGRKVAREVALGLYVAILTDTGSFRFSNSSPRAHRIVAELLELGVDPEDTHRRVYGNFPLRKLRLLQASLATLEVDSEGDLAWMTVPREVYASLSATQDDLDGLVDYPRVIQGVEGGVLFRETAGGGTKISFRSNGDVDVNVLARRFGGGGHTKAAGALVERKLPEVREEVLVMTREAIRSVTRKVENS